jgi:hypothetical protein
LGEISRDMGRGVRQDCMWWSCLILCLCLFAMHQILQLNIIYLQVQPDDGEY